MYSVHLHCPAISQINSISKLTKRKFLLKNVENRDHKKCFWKVLNSVVMGKSYLAWNCRQQSSLTVISFWFHCIFTFTAIGQHNKHSWDISGVTIYLVWWQGSSLSNDPGKKGSNFFCYGTICFPHIRMFLFLHRKCVNLQNGSLQSINIFNLHF